MDDKEKQELDRFRLQDIFDLRYAKKEEIKLIRAIVFGAVGLIISTALLGMLSLIFHPEVVSGTTVSNTSP